MFVDTSAVVAVLLNEPAGRAIARALDEANELATTPLVLLEAACVLAGRLDMTVEDAFDTAAELLSRAGVRLVALDYELARAAAMASDRYGKGRGSPARLNICDVVVYAAAKAGNGRLLFVGSDFGRTDLVPALAQN